MWESVLPTIEQMRLFNLIPRLVDHSLIAWPHSLTNAFGGVLLPFEACDFAHAIAGLGVTFTGTQLEIQTGLAEFKLTEKPGKFLDCNSARISRMLHLSQLRGGPFGIEIAWQYGLFGLTGFKSEVTRSLW